MKLSKLTIAFGIYIIASSLFMAQAWKACEAAFGPQGLILFLIFLCLAAASAILYRNIKSGLNAKRICLNLLLLGWGFIFSWRQPYFPERAHVLEFALLGWMAIRDLDKERRNNLAKYALAAFLFTAIIGVLEEGFQKLLPWRVCDIRDMITDAVSGAFGITLFLNSRRRQG